uniref:Uncharacterized protein n=1 Tax=Palpitomonas bilix TaxID=652834 RepID=A0A7S3CZV0_9EUKA|mmetsp:Transcript_16166/g.40899  ORF Transcript_16166/g.40899 Transcript_16166/m.40899 type:complete len:191 (+) Transcript_16166:237-809(+)|eukprot:CAMPEP_0113900210 /NCGR_PEP_ID=MMETSP0780_2-20120614/20532_1 /TAXON_ID=652834 /ORGANISM="Palpitomonas bilix" /LENGTH=190 /DNA_ID=CAMNT_0000892607 /DNA_START=237 /DNA_END=809 /DNA_ORIENTATION=- /assembly_acc=CAM_ASM_000599
MYRLTSVIVALAVASSCLVGSVASISCETCTASRTMGFCVADGNCYPGSFNGATAASAPSACKQKNTGAWIYGASLFAYKCPSCAQWSGRDNCTTDCADGYSGICGWCFADEKCYPGTSSGTFVTTAPAACTIPASGGLAADWEPKTPNCALFGTKGPAVILSGVVVAFALLFLIIYTGLNARHNAKNQK